MDCITAKKLQNKRFSDNETIVIKFFLKFPENPSLERLTAVTHISRSTICRHHGSINNVVPNYEHYILQKFQSTIHHHIELKGDNIKNIYQKMLLFIINDKLVFHLLIVCDKHDIITQMIYTIRPQLLAIDELFSNDEIFDIYAKAISSLINAWQRNDFPANDISILLSKIMYLTNAAHPCLGPISAFDQ